MSLAYGRPYLAIPGPSTMPDRVLAAMHRPAPNIYAGEIVDMLAGIKPDLRRVARTTQNVAIYIANGHGTWEAANANLFSRGDRALVLATGRFGLGWAESARAMGVDVEVIDFGLSHPADPARLEAALRADTDRRIRAVLVSHVDTATSIRNDIPALRAAMDAAGHPALLAVDAIASLGCDVMEMDLWGVDVLVSASQKGLMVPPGLGFLWISDRALAACHGSDLRTPYWDWERRVGAAEFWQNFCGTAPTHHLFGLRESLTMILDEEGIEAVWARHARLSAAVWAAFETWGIAGAGAGCDIALNVADRRYRAASVTAARIGGGGAERLRAWCEAEAGVTLGIGLGMAEPRSPAFGDFLRVAHMGHVSAHMTLGVLSVMEAGLQALGITHGAGGLAAAAAEIARGGQVGGQAGGQAGGGQAAE
ncbi:pyridoxal-phosphate-dependent aminotransferase family protein [Phaeovulum vinaykumarii]|uniref:Alanine-glyoxylate transaminase / serine-glyoxylate transaminase / serine-pyruvate transaminase n=1 Tax=Phaeovulum vinaykumarii TaxID=407234 RepID=A0A1N7JUA0_9RHOB|nr:aminotransferase class V-fold PLP-dependent enzyme [Phaeovulum vinaykumarii]SIS52806.1 alanine-glyoxylate transaminase / serine-glyoxylate transaminase / serine-pyruvate transaminase [Phaeovulum vinaykumarii]SOB91377.1 alanine-glyoxylate transaminase/serine-glyoxylate transaminase/serine-pyruvate transaminase [Phaeovulum vinaykumarii]